MVMAVDRFLAAERNGVCWKNGKVRYAARRAAKGAAKTAASNSGLRIYFYRCPYCKDFHLTKQRQRNQ